jgi:hypothetical protein
VHDWLHTGALPARRSRGDRWAIPFPPEVEAACRDRLAASPHIHRDADDQDRRPGEVSIAALADRLGVKPDVVYYWARRGYLPTRRGKAGRRWVHLTDQLARDCHQRIAGSYKLPEHVKSQPAQVTERVAV